MDTIGKAGETICRHMNNPLFCKECRKRRILVCGDRNWQNKKLIRTWLEKYEIEVVIEGEARGADTFGRIVGLELGARVLKFPADWTTYGKAAGPIRNEQMLVEGQPDLVLAFHNDIENSKGTKDMVTRAKKANIETIVISE